MKEMNKDGDSALYGTIGSMSTSTGDARFSWIPCHSPKKKKNLSEDEHIKDYGAVEPG
jgi:hypothetical protein